MSSDKRSSSSKALDLKTGSIQSHNQDLAYKRLKKLVRLIARRAAEHDFKASKK